MVKPDLPRRFHLLCYAILFQLLAYASCPACKRLASSYCVLGSGLGLGRYSNSHVLPHQLSKITRESRHAPGLEKNLHKLQQESDKGGEVV